MAVSACPYGLVDVFYEVVFRLRRGAAFAAARDRKGRGKSYSRD